MQTPAFRILVRSGLTLAFLLPAGCELWYPPIPTSSQLNTGLVVLYPGSFNTFTEMQGFNDGLRLGGVNEAIQVVQWAPFLEHMLDPPGALPRQRERAKAEALRLADYKRQYSDCPITLIGYSGGGLMAILAASYMPEGVMIDRVILMSPAVSKDFDLLPTLDHTRLGVIHYWSHREQFTVNVSHQFGLADGTHGDPASTYGFTMSDPRLQQIQWDPAWSSYGYNGEHWEYLFNHNWIADFVAPWVVSAHE